MAFSFDQIFAADPANPSNIAQNASITIFAPGDVTMTPLTITDPDGQALANPIPVNANGFGSAFAHATLDRVAWAGGGFTGFFTSYEGMKQVALDAQAAAETAATTAGVDAAAVATAAIGDATDDAAAAAASAATAASNASASATAAANSAALVGAPADAAVETLINSASATKAALNATYGPTAAGMTSTFVPKSQRGIGPVTFPPRPIVAPITTFQTGHAWTGTVTAGGTNFAADTVDYLVGLQSLKAITNGTGGSAEIKAPTQSPALNLTGKGLAFQIKVDNPDRLNYVTIYWGSGNYANFHTSSHLEYQGTGASARLLPNDWTWVYIPATDFITTTGTVVDSNITDVKVLFVDKNTGPLTVHIQQVGIYTPKTTYPNGVISVTCDDSLLSQYVHLPYIMSRYGAGATCLLIADQMPGTQGFTIDQAHELEDKHGYEMGGHAYTKANHDVGLATLSAQALADELGNLKSWLRTEGFKGSDYFAWPVGSNDVASTKIARRYFSWARHTGGYYAPAQYPSQPMRHQAVTVTSDTPLATFQGYIDFAKLHGRHLTLMVHQILSSGATGPTNVNRNDLIAILDYANAQGMPIRTIGQVMRGE